MLDSVKIKMMKKQLDKKDEEIANLLERNASLEAENSTLREKTAKEQAKLDEAADMASATIKEYRTRILEAESLHQKLLQLTEETQKINTAYKQKFEELIEAMRKTKEGT